MVAVRWSSAAGSLPAGGTRGMEATDWIAGYAAVVATATFGWEVWKAIRARRPPVEVKLSNALLTFLPGPPWAAMVNVLTTAASRSGSTRPGSTSRTGQARP